MWWSVNVECGIAPATAGMWQRRQSAAAFTGQDARREGASPPARWHSRHLASYQEAGASASRGGSWQEVQPKAPSLAEKQRLWAREVAWNRMALGAEGGTLAGRLWHWPQSPTTSAAEARLGRAMARSAKPRATARTWWP